MPDVKPNSADNSIDTSCDSSIDLEHLTDSSNVTGLRDSSSEWESDWGKHITLYFLYLLLQIQYHQDDTITKNSKLTRLINIIFH